MMRNMKKLIQEFCRHFDIDVYQINSNSLEHQLVQLAKTYQSKEILQSESLNMEQTIQIYSDGSCSGNPGKGGWGAVICYPNNEEIRISGSEPITTNNRMELRGIIEALEHVSTEKKLSSTTVTITTDSQYVKNGITRWIHTWKKNGWKTASKEVVKNQDLWKALEQLNNTIKPCWVWTKGHAGHYYNEICDTLAVTARNKLTK